MSIPKPLQVVTIGGGSGQYALLSGLRDLEGIFITAIVAMTDSGGSTGRLRDELGILPPGDILKCVLALSPHREIARTILQKRFTSDRRLNGHNAGNMLLIALSRYTGSFPTGVKALAEILEAKGTILPVTIDQATLAAELTDGTRIFGESAIDIPHEFQREQIRDVFLVPHHSNAIHVYPPVIDAIGRADYIILGPGDLFTSIIPNLIVPKVAEALCETKASMLYVINIMNKYGETHQFQGIDFVTRLESFIGRHVDGLIYNTQPPNAEICARYAAQRAEYVMVDPSDQAWAGRRMYAGDFLDTTANVVRHDSKKLAERLRSIFQGGQP